MKQTAVEWLVDQLLKGEFINDPDELIKQAKQMEKAEKAKEYLRGYNDAKKFDKLIEDIQEH